MQTITVLNKIHEDLELLKREVLEIKTAISLEPELKSRVKRQVEGARKRIAAGEFVSNKDVLKEFGLE